MPPPPPPPPGAPLPPPTFALANTQKPKITKSEGNSRNALLDSIAQGKKLKSAKHLMVDKSGPAVGGGSSNKNKFKTMPSNQPNPVRGGAFTPGGNRNVTPKSSPAPPVPSGNGSRNLSTAAPKMPGQRDFSGGATVGRLEGGNVQGPPALAGLFAGGMPALRKTGNRTDSGSSSSAVAPPPPRAGGAASKPAGKKWPPVNTSNGPTQQVNNTARNNVPPPPSQQRNNVPPPPSHQRNNFPPPPPSQQRNNRPPPPPSQQRNNVPPPPPSQQRNNVPPPPPSQQRNNVPPPPPSLQRNNVSPPSQWNNAPPAPQRNAVPPPPPHTNKPSLEQLGVTANNGHVVNSSDNFRPGPPPHQPNMAGRGKPTTPSPSRPPPVGARGAHPPPPPPNRVPPAVPTSNGPMQQRRSPGFCNRPMPAVPSQSDHRPPSLPSRGSQPPPPPPHRTNNQTAEVPPPPPPSRSPMTKVQPPVSTPPPPPSRAPAVRPMSAGGRNSHGNMNGTNPPPPPSRSCPRSSVGSGYCYDTDFERQFKFADISKLPAPEKFIQRPKTYPSQNTKNPANRRNLPPPPRPM